MFCPRGVPSLVSSPAWSSTPASAETTRRESGLRDLTKRQRGMSTGIAGEFEELVGKDGEQGHRAEPWRSRQPGSSLRAFRGIAEAEGSTFLSEIHGCPNHPQCAWERRRAAESVRADGAALGRQRARVALPRSDSSRLEHKPAGLEPPEVSSTCRVQASCRCSICASRSEIPSSEPRIWCGAFPTGSGSPR